MNGASNVFFDMIGYFEPGCDHAYVAIFSLAVKSLALGVNGVHQQGNGDSKQGDEPRQRADHGTDDATANDTGDQ